MTISLPLSVTIPRKTKEDKAFALNLNNFRNAHHMVMNQAKVIWKDIVTDALIGKCVSPMDGPLMFTYTVFPGSGRAFDIANICPAVQKFTDDALQELGVIANDNYKVVKAVNYRFGGIDKDNPRIELEITHWEDK